MWLILLLILIYGHSYNQNGVARYSGRLFRSGNEISPDSPAVARHLLCTLQVLVDGVSIASMSYEVVG